jgi:chromosome segregation ATPase
MLRLEAQAKESAEDSLRREVARGNDLQKRLREAERALAEKEDRIAVLENNYEKVPLSVQLLCSSVLLMFSACPKRSSFVTFYFP